MERLELNLPTKIVTEFREHSRSVERPISATARDALSLYLKIVSLLKRRGGPIVIEIDHSLSYLTVLHDQADKDKPEYTPLFPFLKPIS
jgi:hypothetical protein